jgi:hypothetical protein
VYVSLVSIKCSRRSCGLRKVWCDTNECFVATLDGQLFVTRVTRRVLLMEQDLLSHPKHLRWPPIFSGVLVARSLVFSVLLFVDRWFVRFVFAIVLSVLLRFAGFGYTLSIFKLFLYVVLVDSFFHSLFLLYHYKHTPSFYPVQPFTSIFYYLSVCSRRDPSYITAQYLFSINQCIWIVLRASSTNKLQLIIFLLNSH